MGGANLWCWSTLYCLQRKRCEGNGKAQISLDSISQYKHIPSKTIALEVRSRLVHLLTTPVITMVRWLCLTEYLHRRFHWQGFGFWYDYMVVLYNMKGDAKIQNDSFATIFGQLWMRLWILKSIDNSMECHKKSNYLWIVYLLSTNESENVTISFWSHLCHLG